MEFNVTYNEVSKVSINYEASLNPEDYLDCDTEEEVRDTIQTLEFDPDYGDAEFEENEHCELIIPDEFFEEWHKLKNQ